MIQKTFEDITEHDLQALIDNSVFEMKTLEYKKILPSNTDSEKKEFLADVSSFANAQGGDLIYGIASENTSGAPQLLEGLYISNVDQEIARLDNSIRDGIEPRISGIAIKSITLANQNIALLIRIPKSWNLPHRVTYKGHDKFYSRSTNGKYPLDVSELRNAFSLSSSLVEKIRSFRTERIMRILAGEVPFSLNPFPKFGIKMNRLGTSSVNIKDLFH